MWRAIAVFLFGGILGTAVGVAGGLFIYPYLFPPPPAMEELAADRRGDLIATGQFIHANPSDPVHWGKGAVSVYDGVVRLEPDFAVGPGPRFHVYLVPAGEIRESAQVKGAMFVDLGRLRAFEGSQNFRIPAGVELRDYPSVVIWCAEFGVLISPADLQFRDS